MPNIADLPIWEKPARVTAKLTVREAEIVNQLRSIESDEAYVAIAEMFSAMLKLHHHGRES